MATKTNREVATGLRKLADLLESNPTMAQPYEGTHAPILFMSHEKEEFQATIRAFGSGAKEDGGETETLNFTPANFPIPVKVFGFKRAICQGREVRRFVPERIELERVIPAHEVTVMEYSCAPFLEPVESDESYEASAALIEARG